MSTISFARLAIDSDKTQTGAQAANELDWLDLSNAPHIEYQQFLALIGDGDQTLEEGEGAYNLADSGYGGRVTTLKTENAALDPVIITGSGRINNNTDGDLTPAVRFDNARGFGLDNGPDGEGMARWLNGGDAIDVQVNAIDGVAGASLRTVSFIVNVRDDAATQAVDVVLDFDGDLLLDTNGAARQGGFVTDGLLTLAQVADGARVEIDFVAETLTLNGIDQTVDLSFWDAFADYGRHNLTIGTAASDGTGFAIKDLVLETGDATVLDFDDIALSPGGETALQGTGYGGFTWQQAGVYHPNGDLNYKQQSGSNLAFIGEQGGFEVSPGYDQPAGSPLVISRATDFTFLGAAFSGQSYDNMPVTIEAYDDGVRVGSKTITVPQGGPTWFGFSDPGDGQRFEGIDELRMRADDGRTAEYFGFDDFTFIG
jgi:hypothetical protein